MRSLVRLLAPGLLALGFAAVVRVGVDVASAEVGTAFAGPSTVPVATR